MLKVKINRSTNKTEEVVFIKSKSNRVKSLLDFGSKSNYKIIPYAFKSLAFIVVPCLAAFVWLYNQEHYIITASAFVVLFSSLFVGFLFLSKMFTNDGVVRYNVRRTDAKHDYKDVIWFYVKNYHQKPIYVGLTEEHITVIFPEKSNGLWDVFNYTRPLIEDFYFNTNDRIVSLYDFVELNEKMSSNVKAVRKEFYNLFDDLVDVNTVSKYIRMAEECVKPLIYKDCFDD